jgi:hypothetical protein
LEKKIAIVTPVYRLPLEEDEKLCLGSITKHLSWYNHVFIVPQRLHHDVHSIAQGKYILRFDNKYFENVSGYNNLLLSAEFYEHFQEYEYILIAQLDSLVLSDQLEMWCEKGWDYIGAPWMRNYGYQDTSEFLTVGNGGFSLRNVSAAVEVLKSRVEGELWDLPKKDKKLWGRKSPKRFHPINIVKAICKKYSIDEFLKLYYRGNEDVFWGKYASLVKSEFHIPAPMEALQFAFEKNPTESLKLNNGKLPFGCHAWAKYDRGFWETHLKLDEFAT